MPHKLKLDWEQVEQIRNLNYKGVTAKELGASYGVSLPTIYDVLFCRGAYKAIVEGTPVLDANGKQIGVVPNGFENTTQG